MPKPKTKQALKRAIRQGAYADDRYDPWTRHVLFLAWLYDYGQIGDPPADVWQEPTRWQRDAQGVWHYRPGRTEPFAPALGIEET